MSPTIDINVILRVMTTKRSDFQSLTSVENPQPSIGPKDIHLYLVF